MTEQATTLDRLRSYRRRRIRWVGKRLTRWLSDFFARQSLVGDSPFIESARFDFTALLEANWPAIRDEAKTILRQRTAIPAFHEVSPDQRRISTGRNWQTFVLYGFKRKLARNCALCPVTTATLERIPGLQTAWFSIIAPRYHIPEHRGLIRGVLTCHLGPIVPADKERCRIRVTDQVRHWEAGRSLVFDDSLRHEVWNDTDEDRVVLLVQFTRPMRPLGRLVNDLLLALVKMSAYYQEPKKNMARFEERFQAAVRRAEAYQLRDG